ncbi:MAG: TVP38/TMEM64 family protein [Planctomycetales bacterium]|nr:TVP38/TMEM64 family protein [Planctomycetales bacterium]
MLLIALVATGVAWLLCDGLFPILIDANRSPADKLAAVRAYFLSFGAAAPLVYLAAVIVEVVIAPLPGAMLYAPGGAIFGGFWGGLLSLIGNVVGACVAFVVMRALGQQLSHRFLAQPALRRLQEQIASHGVAVVFALRVNPLTSSDLVSYAAGLTSMPLWKLALGTLLGMAPLCWVQSYASHELLASFPSLVIPVALLCVLYGVVAVGVAWRLVRDVAQREAAENQTSP